MSKETYTRIISKYFSNQNNIIGDDLTDEDIDDLSFIYGFGVKRGDEVFRYFIKDGDNYTVNYFSTTHRSAALRYILLDHNNMIEFRGGIPVFG